MKKCKSDLLTSIIKRSKKKVQVRYILLKGSDFGILTIYFTNIFLKKKYSLIFSNLKQIFNCSKKFFRGLCLRI